MIANSLNQTIHIHLLCTINGQKIKKKELVVAGKLENKHILVIVPSPQQIRTTNLINIKSGAEPLLQREVAGDTANELANKKN